MRPLFRILVVYVSLFTPLFAAFLISTALSISNPLFAQVQVPPPPDILQIYREPVKPGKMAEYKRLEAEAAMACSRANTWPYVTMEGISGPQEVWFVSGFDSYAAMERSAGPFVRNATLANELSRIMDTKSNLVAESRAVFLRYRQELGNNRGLMRPQTRFFTATMVQVIPGHEREYEESQRILRGVRERAAATDNRAVYQVISGMPQNTYLTLSPYHSFREAGESLDGVVDYDDVDESVRGRVKELLSTSVLSSQTFVFAVDPAISNPAGEWIADDPDFWKLSPAMRSGVKK
jgi:hypothetical protein